MADQSQGRLDPKTKIDILLKEYETLRNEIQVRINNRFTIFGLFAATGTFTATQSRTLLNWIIASLFVMSLLVLWWRLGYLIKRCSSRIAELEQLVNELAGEELLAWEGRVAKVGLFHRIYRDPPKA